MEEEDARAVRSPNGYYPNSIPPPYRAVALIANSRPSVLPRLRATCSGRRCGLAGWLAGWLAVRERCTCLVTQLYADDSE